MFDWLQVGHEKSWFKLDGSHYITHCRNTVVTRRSYFSEQVFSNKVWQIRLEVQEENRYRESKIAEQYGSKTIIRPTIQNIFTKTTRQQWLPRVPISTWSSTPICLSYTTHKTSFTSKLLAPIARFVLPYFLSNCHLLFTQN